MKIKIFFSVFLLVILSSCEKQVDTLVQFEGIVIDAKDKNPLSNATVKLIRVNDTRSFTSVKDSTVTDINCFYNFSFDGNDYNTYTVSAEKDRYTAWSSGKYIIVIPKQISKTNVNIDTVIIGRESLLKLYIHSELENNDFDNYLLLTNTNFTIEPIDYLSYRRYYLPPGYFDTTIVEKYLYDYNHHISISRSKQYFQYDSTYYEIIDEVDLIPLDTTYLSLELQ